MSTGRLGAGDTAIQPTLLDAKGDLIAATAADTPARLAVGANGESLVADSSTATGLRWQGSFEAGKNKIINGDFRINQRSFSSTTTTGVYTFDRWITETYGGTGTYSAQTFTPGAAPVAGYEGVNFLRIVTTGQSAGGDYTLIDQRIEDVRSTAGQTVTVSFWAKAASGTPKVGVGYQQNFGSGGSAAVSGSIGDVTISTSWARYSVTAAIPSVSGKTLGTGSYFRTLIWTSAGSGLSTFTNIGLQSATIDLWGIQLENGNVATPFQTATGTLQGELAACFRYYINYDAPGFAGWSGYVPAASSVYFVSYPFYTRMRVQPTVTIVTSSDSAQMGTPTVGDLADWSSSAVRFQSTSTGTAENRAFFLVSSWTASAEL